MPEKGKKGVAKKTTPQKESVAKKAVVSPAANKKTKANAEEEKEEGEAEVSTSSEPRPAVNPQHKDNSLREFRRLCAGIAERPGMYLASESSTGGSILITRFFQGTLTNRLLSASGCHRDQAKRSSKVTCCSG